MTLEATMDEVIDPKYLPMEGSKFTERTVRNLIFDSIQMEFDAPAHDRKNHLKKQGYMLKFGQKHWYSFEDIYGMVKDQLEVHLKGFPEDKLESMVTEELSRATNITRFVFGPNKNGKMKYDHSIMIVQNEKTGMYHKIEVKHNAVQRLLYAARNKTQTF